MANYLTIRFVTFIPRNISPGTPFPNWVPDPDNIYQPDAWYGGDAREFTPYTNNNEQGTYRTAQQVNIDFINRKLVHYRGIGTTYRYEVNAANQVTNTTSATASAACLTLPSYSFAADGSTCTFRIVCACGNPLETGAPVIDYDFTITAYRSNGTLYMSGEYDGFPAYEAYKQIDYSGTWLPILRHDPRVTGDTPNALFPPTDYTVNKWN